MKVWIYVFISIISNHCITCFKYKPCITKSKSKQLYLFNFFNKNKDNSKVQPVTKVDIDKVDKLRNNLEKISNKQNRDYEAEAKANAPRKKEIADKQLLSFNFNKADEFPNLYKGWIRSEGDQIAKQMISSTKSALSKNEKYIEVLFDPVPNLDEVAFGTEWNKRLRKDVVAELKVPDYATNRGGPSTLEWSTLYWANRLCIGALSNKKVLLISISGEGTKGNNLPTLGKGVKLVTLSESKKDIIFNSGDVYDAIILLSPCQESHYIDGKKLADKYNIPLIALNAPYSYRYDVGRYRYLLLYNYI